MKWKWFILLQTLVCLLSYFLRFFLSLRETVGLLALLGIFSFFAAVTFLYLRRLQASIFGITTFALFVIATFSSAAAVQTCCPAYRLMAIPAALLGSALVVLVAFIIFALLSDMVNMVNKNSIFERKIILSLLFFAQFVAVFLISSLA